MQALYRPRAGADWQEVTVVGRHQNGQIILRETGRHMSGLILADVRDVRVPVVSQNGLALLDLDAAKVRS